MKYGIIIHYDEIGLKGHNRDFFEQTLVDNISEKIRVKSLKGRVKKLFGRIWIDLDDFACGHEREAWKSLCETTFGIAYFGFSVEVPSVEASFIEAIKYLATSIEFETFRITTTRTEKNFPLNSMEINQILGGTVLRNFEGKKVKLKNPDAEFFLEIVGKKAFGYVNKIAGPGGLPVGTAGKALVLISGGIDSPVAVYYMQKRGLKVEFIHFHSYPQTSQQSVEKVRMLTKKLTKFDPFLKLHMCPFLEIQKVILKTVPDKFRIIFYRRFMLRIAEKLAYKIKAKGLITGESLSQVASQTIENMTVIQQSVGIMPILRPLIGFDKREIIEVAKRIDTFQISIKPHDDCCTVFMPQNPETKGKIEEVLDIESKFSVTDLVAQGIENLSLEKITS